MAIYPPNTTPPQRGLNYMWNFLGSSLKTFANALLPYLDIPPTPPPTPNPYTSYIAKISSNSLTGQPVVNVLYNDTGLTLNWIKDTLSEPYRFQVSSVSVVDSSKVWINNTMSIEPNPASSTFRIWNTVLVGSPGDGEYGLQGFLSATAEATGPDTVAFYIDAAGIDESLYIPIDINLAIGFNNPYHIEIRIYS